MNKNGWSKKLPVETIFQLHTNKRLIIIFFDSKMAFDMLVSVLVPWY
jgi:hypothetical protein